MRSAAALVMLTACSAVQLKVHEPSIRPELVGVFVYPFGFRWNEPAYRSFELSERLVAVGLETSGERLAFWGPGEFKVMRPQDDAAWVASTALPLLTSTGAKPDQAVVIRPWAEQRVNSSTQEASDARGRRAAASQNEETVYIGHVEVIHPATHEVLIESEAQVKVDPFAEAPPDADFDPAPALTHLMEGLMRACVKKVASWAVDRKTQALPPQPLALTPAASVRWQDGARPSAELEMAKMDAASLDLFLQARARFLNPTLPDTIAAKLSKMLPGLYVSGPAEAPLSEGDLLTTIDEQPAQPQVWSRLRFGPQAPAKVRKPSGEIVEIMLP